MTDASLLVFGCVVSFMTVGGAYVYLRARYLDGDDSPAERAADLVPALPPQRVAPAERR